MRQLLVRASQGRAVLRLGSWRVRVRKLRVPTCVGRAGIFCLRVQRRQRDLRHALRGEHDEGVQRARGVPEQVRGEAQW